MTGEAIMQKKWVIHAWVAKSVIIDEVAKSVRTDFITAG